MQTKLAQLYPGPWRTPELPSTLWRCVCQRTVPLKLSGWGRCFALLRPDLDQVLLVQYHAPTDRFP